MSTLGKASAIAAIVLSVMTAVFGFLLASKKTEKEVLLASIEESIRRAPPPVTYSGDRTQLAEAINRAASTLKSTQDELQTAQTELTATKDKIGAAEAAAQQALQKQTTAEKVAEEKTAAATAAEAQLQTVSQELAKFNDLLRGRNLETLLSEHTQNSELLKALDGEKRLIQDQLAKLNAELTKYRELVNLSERKVAPLELSGKVLAINKAWNFVVLDVGKNDRLVEGVNLTVYRGDTLIGKIKTVAVDNDTAIADIVPEWTQTEIQVGDQVLF